MISASEIQKVAIIGAGSWGTCIAKIIAENNTGISVILWAFEKSAVYSINEIHENTDFLPGIQLPPNVRAVSQLKEAVRDAEVIILANPSKVIYDIAVRIARYASVECHIGYLSKGFCKIDNEIFTISQTIEKAIPHHKNRVVAIYGPSHAEEVSRNYHTCLNVAGKEKKARRVINELLSTDYLQCRELDDIIGVELGGTLKNPAAIAAGMISVLPQCGDNLAGALISEALKEMILLGEYFDADMNTMIDISGLGDLVATALSDHSRNRRFGKDIASQILSRESKLKILDKIFLTLKPHYVIERMSEKLHYLAEGAYAIEPLIELAEKNNISIPVYRSLYEVLLNKKEPSLLIETIKNPKKFAELYKKSKMQITEKQKGLESLRGRIFLDKIIGKSCAALDSNRENDFVKSVIKNLKNDRDRSAAQMTSREIEIIERITEVNYNDNVKSLVQIYVREILDNYNPFVKWIFFFLLNLINLTNVMKSFGKNSNILIGGDVHEINKISKSANVIYLPFFPCRFGFLFALLAIYKKKMPYPRFFVSKSSVNGTFDAYIIKRIGGFIVDDEKMENTVYKECLCQYIATMVEHGVPIMYVPQKIIDLGTIYDKADFFSTIYESLLKYTVDIVLVPVEVNPKKYIYERNMNSAFFHEILSSTVHVHFSDPILLSDYADKSEYDMDIKRTLKRTWLKDRRIFPHSIICRIIVDRDYTITLENVRKSFYNFEKIKAGRLIYEVNKKNIFNHGLQYLIKENIIVLQKGEIKILDKVRIDYFAANM